MKDQTLDIILKRVEKLEKAVFGSKSSVAGVKRANHKRLNVNFDLNKRAFVKKYAQDMSGPKKFTLFIAFLATGRVSIDVQIDKVRGLWDSTATLHGSSKLTSGQYATRAKEDGWIDSEKNGTYYLTSSWMDIFE